MLGTWRGSCPPRGISAGKRGTAPAPGALKGASQGLLCWEGGAREPLDMAGPWGCSTSWCSWHGARHGALRGPWSHPVPPTAAVLGPGAGWQPGQAPCCRLCKDITSSSLLSVCSDSAAPHSHPSSSTLSKFCLVYFRQYFPIAVPRASCCPCSSSASPVPAGSPGCEAELLSGFHNIAKP